jgi:hypothetical protein
MNYQIQGQDVVVTTPVVVTCFGGGYDTGDDGQTESGVLNDGSNPNLMGCALPVRSTEASTRPSPFADPNKPHIPWGTTVLFWSGTDESKAISTKLIDNGPDVAKYPTHWGDLTVKAAAHFAGPNFPTDQLANNWNAVLSYRIVGGAPYVLDNRFRARFVRKVKSLFRIS